MSKDFELLNSFERSDSLCSPSPQVKLLNLLLSRNVEKFVEVFKNNLNCIDVNYFYEEPENGTLLDVACRSKGNRKFVDVLIQYGADVNAINCVFDKLPLQVAVENSDTETVEGLLQCRQCEINAKDKSGNTALHVAAKLNKVNFIDILLKHPAIDINAVNRKQQTPLHLALTQGSREAIRVLLGRLDIDLDEVNDFRSRSCREIIDEKYPEYRMELPRMNKASERGLNDSLFMFLRNRDVKSFLRLAKVNKHCLNENDGSYTYLQYACVHGLGEVVDTLINIGVDPNGCCPNNGKPPLLIAAEKGYHDIVLKLIRNSDTSLYPVADTTVLHALMQGMYSHEKSLLGDSGDCDYRKCLENILQETPRERLEQLDLNFRDVAGNTALHHAAKLNDDDTVRALLEAGAYVGHKNNKGTMPLEWINPDVLEEYLDRCISTNDKAAREPSYEIIYNYKILAPPRKQSYFEKHGLEIDEKEIYDVISETEPLLVMNSIPELRRLLAHPVLTSFLNLKWYTIRKYFFINLVFYLTFWISLTSYILYTYGLSNTRNSTANATENVAVAGSNPYVPINDTLLWYITLMLCGVLFLREFFQFIISPWPYVKSPENWLEMGLICISGAVLVCQTDLDERPQLAAVAILASWMELILLVGRHPLLSTNIEMFKTVSLNFLKFLAWYSILILAFAFSFYILFNDRAGEDDIFFRNPAMSVFKSVIMLTGEFDAGSIPFGEKLSTSHLLFILFVFLVAIVLFNLLNGLAVSDTQAIRADAELVGIVSRVKLISYVEKIAVSDPFPCLSFTDKLACCCCCAPLKQVSHKRQKHIKMFYKRINLFPHTLADDQVRVRPNEGNTMVMSDAITKYRDDDSCFVRCADWRIDPNIIKDTNKVLEKYRKKNEALNFTELIKEYTEQLKEYKLKLETVESASERNEKLLKEIMGVLKQRL